MFYIYKTASTSFLYVFVLFMTGLFILGGVICYGVEGPKTNQGLLVRSLHYSFALCCVASGVTLIVAGLLFKERSVIAKRGNDEQQNESEGVNDIALQQTPASMAVPAQVPAFLSGQPQYLQQPGQLQPQYLQQPIMPQHPGACQFSPPPYISPKTDASW